MNLIFLVSLSAKENFRKFQKLPEPLKCSQASGPVFIITVISQSQ